MTCACLFPCVVVPHVTDAIQEWVEKVAQIPVASDQKRPDICVIEVHVHVSVSGERVCCDEVTMNKCFYVREEVSERERERGGGRVHFLLLQPYISSPAWWYHR